MDSIQFVKIVEAGKVFGVEMIDMSYVVVEVFVVIKLFDAVTIHNVDAFCALVFAVVVEVLAAAGVFVAVVVVFTAFQIIYVIPTAYIAVVGKIPPALRLSLLRQFWQFHCISFLFNQSYGMILRLLWPNLLACFVLFCLFFLV